MRSNTVWLLGLVVIAVWILNTGIVQGLICLQCNSVPQPRHCLSVVHCDADEACYSTWSLLTQQYRLGCRKRSLCTGNVPHNNTTCRECCSSDLCNAQSCGEPGYPVARGPVCYDCPYHDRRHPCRSIDICAVDEACPSIAAGPSPIIGKRSTENSRSLSQILCNECCSTDLCNLNCSIDHCYSSPCQHGSCSSDGSSFQCHCEAGWTGHTCQERMDHCVSSPCVNGHCIKEFNGFHCQCSNASYGRFCEKINYCVTNLCENGTCKNDDNGFHCTCNHGWTGRFCQNALLSFDCLDILRQGLGSSDGVYSITLRQSREIIQVYCDMTTDGGGWTVFQKRFNGSEEFHRNFSDYDNGFGSVHGSLVDGLKNIHAMTQNVNTILRLDLGNASGSTAYEVYQNFSLSNSPSYTLHIGTASGTAGDGGHGMSYNNGYAFYTLDSDSKIRCTNRDGYYGGWWYNNCNFANVNGEYITPGTTRGHGYAEGSLTYYAWTGAKALSLRTTELKFRRK